MWLKLASRGQEFRGNKRMRGGFSSWCCECHVNATRDWRERNRELDRGRQRERYRVMVERLGRQARASKELLDAADGVEASVDARPVVPALTAHSVSLAVARAEKVVSRPREEPVPAEPTV
jgi:hypothetical protein